MNSSTLRRTATVTDAVSMHMSIPLTLDKLRPGNCATISHIENGELADRMSDMGFSRGVTVRCELICLLGDPVAYRIIDKQTGQSPRVSPSLIALRRTDAEHIRLVDDRACIGTSTDPEADTRCRQEGRTLWD